VLPVVVVRAGAPGFEHDHPQTGLRKALRCPAARCAGAHDDGVHAFAPDRCSADVTAGRRVVLHGAESYYTAGPEAGRLRPPAMPQPEGPPAVRTYDPSTVPPQRPVPQPTRRPRAIVAAAWVFIVVGAGGILKDLLPLLGSGAASAREGLLAEGLVGLALIWTVRLLAVIGGALVLNRSNSGRWLLAVWMAFHVGLSLFHSALQAALHVAIFSALAYVLFRHQASSYFVPSRARRAQAKVAQ
jgi:hypothetical protein